MKELKKKRLQKSHRRQIWPAVFGPFQPALTEVKMLIPFIKSAALNIPALMSEYWSLLLSVLVATLSFLALSIYDTAKKFKKDKEDKDKDKESKEIAQKINIFPRWDGVSVIKSNNNNEYRAELVLNIVNFSPLFDIVITTATIKTDDIKFTGKIETVSSKTIQPLSSKPITFEAHLSRETRNYLQKNPCQKVEINGDIIFIVDGKEVDKTVESIMTVWRDNCPKEDLNATP